MKDDGLAKAEKEAKERNFSNEPNIPGQQIEGISSAWFAVVAFATFARLIPDDAR